MADWDEPQLTSLYTDVLNSLKGRDTDAASLNENPTNPFTGQIRYNRTSNKFQEWGGSSWSDKVLSLAGGGTGGTDATSARSSLGLGSLAVQNSNAINVTGGTIAGLSSLGVSGNLTLSGILIAGSGPTTITSSAGLVLRSAIENNANIADINANETISGNWTFTGTLNLNGSVDIAGGLVAGSGNVGIIGSDGRIPAISSTYFANLSGANLTNIPESAITDGSILARVAAHETITGSWTFNDYLNISRAINSGLFIRQPDAGVNEKHWALLTISNTQLHLRGYADDVGSSALFMSFTRSGINPTAITLNTNTSISGNLSATGSITAANIFDSVGTSPRYRWVETGTTTDQGNWDVVADSGVLQFRSLSDNFGTASAFLQVHRSGSTATYIRPIVPIRLSNGSAASPGLQVLGSEGSGIYYNTTNFTLEVGARFDNSERAIMRAYANSPKLDFLVGNVVAATIEEGGSGTAFLRVGSGFPGPGVTINNTGSVVASGYLITDVVVPIGGGTIKNIGFPDEGDRWNNIYLVNAPNVSSDIRHKKVLGTLNGALDIVESIEPFKFSWKDGNDPRVRPGFSAQDIKSKLDVSLGTNVCNVDIYDVHSIYGEELIPVLWQAVRELYDIVQSRN